MLSQEWLPDLQASVEAQFDTLNKKKEWYKGVVTQINGDDTMTVLFATNVSEANIHPDKVRLMAGKPPKVRAHPPPSLSRPSVAAPPALKFSVAFANCSVCRLSSGTAARPSSRWMASTWTWP